MKRKGVARLSVGYSLIFIQVLLFFYYQGAVNPLSLIFKSLNAESAPVLWYVGLFLVGAAGLALAIWGGIDYKKTAPKASAPADLTKAGDMYKDSKGREYFYDNAKFILIFLVVLAHAISPFGAMKSNDFQYVYLFVWRLINTMHMPCFIFISGYLAKKYIGSDGFINVQRPFTYIIYYLAAQLTVGAFETFVIGRSISKSILAPRSSLWFLICLIWWYLLLPVIEKIDPKIMLPVAIVFALLIGYDEKIGNLMAMSRMIVHFPFFLTGYYLSSGKMQHLFTKKAKLISIPVILAGLGSQLAVLLLFKPIGKLDFGINSIIACASSYYKVFKGTDVNALLWFVPRIWFYVTAALLIYGFLVWVPKRKNIFTVFGARTLGPYILHRYLYIAYKHFDWYKFDFLPFEVSPEVGGLIMIAVAFVITVVFSLYPCYLPFELLGRIKVKPLLKKPAKAQAK